MFVLGTVANFVIAVGFLCAAKVIYNLFFHPLRHFPGPWYTRSSRLWMFIKTIQGTVHFELKALHDKYGDVVRIAPDELNYNNGDDWAEVYGRIKSPDGKTVGYAGKDPKFWAVSFDDENLLFQLEGDDFKAQQKNIAYAFSPRGIREQEPLIASHLETLVTQLHKRMGATSEAVIKLDKWLSNIFFDNACMFVMSQSHEAILKNPDVMHPSVHRFEAAVVRIAYLMQFQRLQKIVCRIADVTISSLFPRVADTFLNLQGLVESRMEEEASEKNKTTLVEGSQKRNDIVSYMLRDDQFSDPRTLTTSVGLFTFAAAETGTTFLCGFFFHVLSNPSVWNALSKDIRETFKNSAEITFTSTHALPYLTGCMNEVFRVYPPIVSSTPRLSPPGGALISGKYVPGGTTIGMFHYCVYQSATNFKTPESFRPERWLEENAKDFPNDKKKALNPFGYGSRSCIGRHMALMVAKLFIVRLVFEFDMELDPRSAHWARQTAGVFPHREKPLFIKFKKRGFKQTVSEKVTANN